jgi:hypothetical protein
LARGGFVEIIFRRGAGWVVVIGDELLVGRVGRGENEVAGGASPKGIARFLENGACRGFGAGWTGYGICCESSQRDQSVVIGCKVIDLAGLSRANIDAKK